MSKDIKITKLVYPETVRQNVGMYLSATNDYTTPLREIWNNSADELLNGHATWMRIINEPVLKLVIDNGRGIPVYADPDHPERCITHSTFTDMHAGSKFSNPDEVTSGVHGVGSSAVNAVSDRYCVAVNLLKKDLSTAPKWLQDWAVQYATPILYIEYRRGILHEEVVLEDVLDLKQKWGVEVPADFSTAVMMVPDTTIYASAVAKVSTLPLQIIVLDKPGVEIFLNDTDIPPYDFANDMAGNSELFLGQSVPFVYQHSDRLTVKGMIGYDANTVNYTHSSLVNLVENPEGGLLEKVLCRALGESLKKVNGALTPGDAKLGLLLFNSSFTTYKLSFGSQTKEKLVGLGLKYDDAVRKCKEEFGQDDEKYEPTDEQLNRYYLYEPSLRDGMIAFFDKLIASNSKYFDNIVTRIIEYKSQMNKLSNMDFVKSKVVMGDESDRKRSNLAEAAKVYEATSRDWAKRELYLTEGLSASGGLIKFRDKAQQSILPLRGKILNSSSMDAVDLVGNGELLAVINTVGCGLGDLIDVSKSRYGKIIIATDSDSDGSHIANLILAIFLMHARPLVEAGMIYKLTPPYYHVKTGNKEEYFGHGDRDKIDFDKSTVTKRKGLGSYSPEEVKKFMINEKTRCLTQITLSQVDDVVLKEAISLLYSSAARKRLMIRTGVLKDEE